MRLHPHIFIRRLSDFRVYKVVVVNKLFFFAKSADGLYWPWLGRTKKLVGKIDLYSYSGNGWNRYDSDANAV